MRSRSEGQSLPGSSVASVAAATTTVGVFSAILGSGALSVGNSAALGGGGVALISGTLQASTAVTLGNAVTLNNSTVTLGGSNPIVLSGAMSLNGLNDNCIADLAVLLVSPQGQKFVPLSFVGNCFVADSRTK